MKIYKVLFMASCAMLITSALSAKIELDEDNRTANIPSAVVSTHFAKPVTLKVSAWDDESRRPAVSQFSANATPLQQRILDVVDGGVQRAMAAVQDNFNPDSKVVSSKVKNVAHQGMTGRELIRFLYAGLDSFAADLVSANTYGIQEGDTPSVMLRKAAPSFHKLIRECAGNGSSWDSAFLVTRTSKHGHFVGKKFAKRQERTLGHVSRVLTGCFRNEKRY